MNSVCKKEEIKVQGYKGNNKPSFVVSMIVWVENSRESSDKLWKVIREFSKIVYRKSVYVSIAFLHSKQSEKLKA